jgi:hypothetical protein
VAGERLPPMRIASGISIIEMDDDGNPDVGQERFANADDPGSAVC